MLRKIRIILAAIFFVAIILCFLDFTGTVIVVSHDREFLDGIVSKVYEFGGGKVKEHLCGIYEYLEMKRIDSLRELERSTDNKGSNAQTPKPLIATETSTEKASASKLSYMEQKERDKMLRKAQKQIADKETVIQNLEIELAEIEKVISAGGDIDQSIFQKYSDVQKQLETAMSYWELACQEYEELKNILNKKIGTKILCLDTCEIFNSKREASRKYNLDRKSLNCVLNEENYSINNLHFEYYNGNSSKEYCLKQLEVLNKRKEANDNRVKIICLDDKQIFNSLADAEREYNIQHAVLSNCINGKYKSANNLHFEKYNKDINYSDTYCIDKINRLEYNRKIKKDDNHKKKILCIEENKLFDSINEALRWLGKSSNGKFNKCLKETNYIYGYHWLFV